MHEWGSLQRAWPQVLPDKDVDGKGLQIQATKPTKEYLAWWGSHGRRGGANGAEDGEAAGEADEEAKEMEAMEKVRRVATGVAPYSTLHAAPAVLQARRFGLGRALMRGRCVATGDGHHHEAREPRRRPRRRP